MAIVLLIAQRLSSQVQVVNVGKSSALLSLRSNEANELWRGWPAGPLDDEELEQKMGRPSGQEARRTPLAGRQVKHRGH